jgi:hypothetical protein
MELIYVHHFVPSTSNEPKKKLKINCERINYFFSEVDMDFMTGKTYCVRQELYNLIESRLFKSHDGFLASIKEGETFSNLKIKPIDYVFDKKQLDDVIGICMYYHKWLYDLWSHSFNRKITGDSCTLKNELPMINNFLIKMNGLNIINADNPSLTFILKGRALKLKSFLLIEFLLGKLSSIIHPENFENLIREDKRLSKILQYTTPDKELGATGKGKNYEVEVTQKHTYLLYLYLKENQIIISRNKNEIVSDRLYYACIADLYSLLTLPEMKAKGDCISWDFVSESYDKEAQIKRIESWIYNYKKKVSAS